MAKIMSKQAQANKLFKTGTAAGDSRKEIIAQIQRVVGVKPAYASTLYQNAKKKAAPTAPATKKSTATTHTPVTAGTKITNLADRDTLRMLREDIQNAINEVAAKHGLTADLGNIRYDREGTSFTSKVTVETGGQADVADRKADKAAENFKRYAVLEGLEPSDFGKEFTYAGRNLKIVGYNTRAKKYPISLEDQNGRGFKVSGRQIASALGH